MAKRSGNIITSATARRARRKATATLSRVQDTLSRVGETTRDAVGTATAKVKTSARKAAKTLKHNPKAKAATVAVAGLAAVTAAGVLVRKRMKRH